jgi:hypothetical protein
MNAGLSNPKRSVMICLVMVALGGGALLWGIFQMNSLGKETPFTAAAIGVGLLVTIVFSIFLFNFVWAVRLTNAMQRGENVIARWTVPPQTLEEFRVNEEELKKAGRTNDYKLPRKIPAKGIDVVFSPSAVMIGDAFFGLSKTGMARFNWIQMAPGNPLAIAFGMAMTVGRASSTGAAIITTHKSELRIPDARTANAEASKVLTHYTAVHSGQTIARPGFWAFRVKIGLWALGIGAVSAAAGFGLNALKVKLGDVPLIMAVSGVMLVLFGVVLAGAASLLGRDERRDRTR